MSRGQEVQARKSIAALRKTQSKDRKEITRTIITARKGITTRSIQHTSVKIKHLDDALRKSIASRIAVRLTSPGSATQSRAISVLFKADAGIAHPQYGGPSTTIVNSQDFGSAAIGGQPVLKTVTYSAPAANTTLTFSLNAGTSFKLQSSSCTATACTAIVSFNPAYPGALADVLSVVDSNSNLVDQTFVSGVGTGPLLGFQFGDTEQDGELASLPAGAAFGPDGSYYVVDRYSQTILKLGTDGEFSSIPIPGLCNPAGIAVDGAGTIYIADPIFNRVLSVSAQGLESVVPTTPLLNPSWLAVDGTGALYISDTGHNRILKLDNHNTETNVLSGLSAPSGIAVDSAGDVFYADSGSNGEIQELQASTGQTITIEPDLGTVLALAIDPSGRIFFTTNSQFGIINYASEDLTTVQAEEGESYYAIAVSSDGRILTTGLNDGLVTVISPANGNLDVSMNVFTPINTTASANLTIVNLGNTPLTLSSIATTAPFTVDRATQCSPDTAIAAGDKCNLQIDFTPTQARFYDEAVTATGNSLNVPGTQVKDQVVGLGEGAPTQTALSVSPVHADAGATVTFTAVVSQTASMGLPAPTGQVSFFAFQDFPDGSSSSFQQVGTVNLPSGSTRAVLTTNQLASGTYEYAAVYAGDDYNAESESSVVNGTVGIGNGTLNSNLTASAATLALNQPLSLTLSLVGQNSAPTGQVTFYEDDGETNSVNLIASGNSSTATLTLSSLTGGSHSFVAGYIGDPNYGPLLSNEVSVSVTPGSSSTTLTINPTAATTTQAVSLVANVTSGTTPGEDGSVIFSDQSGVLGSVPISQTSTGGTATLPIPLTLGSHQITAHYTEDDSYTDSTSAAQTIVITPGGPALDLTISAANINVGQTEILTLLIGAGDQPAETGTVTFQDQNGVLGNANVCACTPLPEATLAISTLSAGVHHITATYNGDRNYAAATSSAQTVTVGMVATITPTTTTLNVSSAAIVVGQAETLTAIVSATGTSLPAGMVTFSDQNGVLGSATLGTGGTGGSGAQATLTLSTLSVGSHQITAAYAGNASFGPSTSQAQVIMVSLAGQTITFPAIPNHIVGDAPFPLSAPASSGLPVTYVVISGPATVSGNAVTLTGTAGTVTIQASQAGDNTYAAAAPVDQSFTVSIAMVLSLTSISPNAAALGSPATPITLTGTDFSTSDIVRLNGSTISSAYINPTSLTAIIPAAFLSKAGTGQVTVQDPQANVTSAALGFNVSSAPQIVFNGPSTAPSGAQPKLTFTLVNPYPVALSGSLRLTFAPANGTGIDDPAVQFSAGGRTLAFAIPANSTATPTVEIQTGTVAGTATIDLAVTANGVSVTPANVAPVVITIPPAVPVITSTALVREGNVLTLSIIGFSNTREALKATFHFNPVAGSDITDPNSTLDVTSNFTAWYTTANSDAYGSAFTYTQIFTLDQDASIVSSINVTLANTVGMSSPANVR